MIKIIFELKLVLVLAFFLGVGSLATAANSSTEAGRIIKATGVKGGLIVHLGCADGKLTMALRVNDNTIVHGLDTDSAVVDKARKQIRSLGLYGSVSVAHLTGTQLPYAENLVNLLVSENIGSVSISEIMRVLVPRGVAYIKKGGAWTKTVKPVPSGIDDWTHFLHGSDNNAVAQDVVAGLPKRMQWVGAPKWGRNHRMATVSSVVSAGGRLFVVADDGPTVDAPTFSGKHRFLNVRQWSLVARDAFNGIVLWKKPFKTWLPLGISFKRCMLSYQRRLVATADRLFFTFGLFDPISVIDPTSGAVIRTYAGTENTSGFVYADGKLLVLVEKNRPEGASSVVTAANTILCIDSETGKVLWEQPASATFGVLAVRDGRVIYPAGGSVVCANLVTGKDIWRTDKILPKMVVKMKFTAVTVVALKDVVMLADGKMLNALSVKTGKKIWSIPCLPNIYGNPSDVFFAQGLIWAAEKGTRPGRGGFSVGRNPMTGEIVKKIDTGDVWGHGEMGHHRCYRNKVTENYILVGQSGTGFIDLNGGGGWRHDWVRGTCGYGVLPCNGLLYAPPHACACYIEGILNGFWALAPAGKESPDAGAQLEKGPVTIKSTVEKVNPADWPTYRHDAARSGMTTSVVPSGVKQIWQTKIGGELSSIVCAEGKLLVSDIGSHIVYALNAKTGEKLWAFTAGGSVDSPPTISQGLAVFGAKDGWVYCLRLSDGKLVWRYRGAAQERHVIDRGSLESAWPVHGSVLILGDIVYFVAGRSSFIDGGIRLNRVKLITGERLSETIVYAPDPKTGKEPKPYKLTVLSTSPATVAKADILSSVDGSIYMRHTKFDLDGVLQDGRGVHLFSSAGFLKNTWFHRAYWAYTADFGSGAYDGWGSTGFRSPAGRLMVVGSDVVYGFGRMTYKENTSFPPYHLFSSEKNDDILKEGVSIKRGGKILTKDKASKAGYSRRFNWSKKDLPFTVFSMLLADKTIFIAGPVGNIVISEESREGKLGAVLWSVSAANGEKIAEYPLPAPPVFDGMITARGKLYLALQDGTVICMANTDQG